MPWNISLAADLSTGTLSGSLLYLECIPFTSWQDRNKQDELDDINMPQTMHDSPPLTLQPFDV